MRGREIEGESKIRKQINQSIDHASLGLPPFHLVVVTCYSNPEPPVCLLSSHLPHSFHTYRSDSKEEQSRVLRNKAMRCGMDNVGLGRAELHAPNTERMLVFHSVALYVRVKIKRPEDHSRCKSSQ